MIYYYYTYKEGTALSKEKKLAKKEAKAAKREAKAEKALAKANAKAEKKHAKAYEKFVKETTKKNEKGEKKAAAGGKAFTAIAIPTIDAFQTKGEIKAEKAGQKTYAKLVKKIDKKNAKLEKKCAKKGKPFVPIPTPSQDEMAARPENKGGKIVLIVILILLIWFLIYFIVRFGAFVYNPAQETTAAEEGTKVAQTYDAYSNPHKITTTPDYSIADAKLLLKQTIHDNWQEVGYSADPSSSSISYNNKVVTVNGADCYVFSCSGKTFAVAVKLSAVYYAHNGEYQPLTFNNTNYLFK